MNQNLILLLFANRLASIQFGKTHFGTGIILDDDTIITLKSLVSGHDNRDLKVVTGITKLNDTNEKNSYNVKVIIFNGNDSDTSLPQNLIALIKLQSEIKFEKGLVEKACVRMYDSDYKHFMLSQMFHVSGFGYEKR